MGRRKDTFGRRDKDSPHSEVLRIKDKQKIKYKRKIISANVEVQTLKTPNGLTFRRTKPIGRR